MFFNKEIFVLTQDDRLCREFGFFTKKSKAQEQADAMNRLLDDEGFDESHYVVIYISRGVE